MARKPATPATAAKTRTAAKRPRKTSAKRAPRAAKSASSFSASAMPGASSEQLVEMARMANMLTPDQAIELYKANAKMALDVINAAIDSTAKLRKLQLSGEESARDLGMRAARGAASAKDPQSLVAVSQETGREALEKSLAYWNEMFDLIVEMQKRLFTLINDQAEGLPGFRHAKAAMALMPDLGPMKNIVSAMQGMVGSGSGAFTSMQKMVGDMARMAQSTMPGAKR